MNKIIPKFRVHKQGQYTKMEDHDYDVYQGYLTSLSDGFYDLTIKKHSEVSPRSNQQNKYYFAVVLPLIGETTGYSDDEVHEIMKVMFLSKPIRIGGSKLEIPRSTTTLTTIEMESYLSNIREWASIELGCSIPTPNEIEES